MKKIAMLSAAAILGISGISLSQAEDVIEPTEQTTEVAAEATDAEAEVTDAESTDAEATDDAEATEAEGEEAAAAAPAEPEEEEPIPEDTPQVKKLIALYPKLIERIQPYGQVCFEGDDNCDITLTASGGSADGEPRDGETVFGQVCKACHGAGVAGAPKVGDSGAWGPRIAQGKDTLYDHAINGFQGNSGNMPARGGNPNLPDEEVQNAVDYMVEQSS